MIPNFILLTSENINGKRLWEKFKNYLYEDSNESNAISEIEQKLNGEEKSLKDFGINIDKISQNYFDDGIDNTDHGRIAHGMIDNLNEEQREIFTEISKSIMKTDNTNRFFIDGPGGTGKTFLYRALYHHLKHNNKKVLCIAWTGIAAILLPGGKTAHRVFKLPLQMTSENDIKPAKLTTALKQILTEVDFIIWDEASMILSTAFQIVNVTLQDLMRNNDPFGGKAVCLGGDFRQLLPVVKKGSRNQIVKSALISSPLWKHFKIFHLKKNMRANNEEFSEWLLQIGNGKKEIVEFPSEMICNENIVDSIFKEYNEETLKTSILLASRNCEVDRLNEEVLSKMEGETIVSEGFSWATAVDGDLTDQDELTLRYQPEYLASLNPSGMPSQNLKLKEGAVVMLLRNICIEDGLCNGTRLIVLKINKYILHCSILTGEKKGKIVSLPKITLNTKEQTNLPFVLNRKQFPVRLAFAMTISKSQGQSFDRVGIFIDKERPMFAHGQLYVALSRCRTKEGLKIKIINFDDDKNKNTAMNIVYQEVLH
ncbi:ATP-dependent DNA helicase pif1-like [Bemisia tabaci]|uniref:ATP-dependent DNA helicase pif1-like n=1 Tax=Bemisia tabaci TaxID=7038 RepID=UPI003B28A7BA